MGISLSQMSALVSQLVEQQTTIFVLLEFEERPIMRPPASEGSLRQVKDRLSVSGRWLPESYATFLRVCDGIENFSVSYSLLGTREILDDSYGMLVASLLESDIGYDHKTDLPPLLIAYDTETTTRVFIDFYHEQSIEGEPVIFEGDPGDMSLHTSFDEFLRFHVHVNELTIGHLQDLRSGKEEE
jgi:hypothetical protein